jgi:hypothetical protein
MDRDGGRINGFRAATGSMEVGKNAVAKIWPG